MTIQTSSTPAFPSHVAPLSGLLKPCIRSALAIAVLTGVMYPLTVTGIAQVLLPHQANGSVVERNGLPVGSSLIGQFFTSARYFHPRPSATTGPDPEDTSKTVAMPYNAALSAASNQGATHAGLIQSVRERVLDYRRLHGLPSDAQVPVDAVTASASGLDPHISIANAQLQLPRIARARSLDVSQVQDLLTRHTQTRVLGLLGEPRVNVFELNLALDAASASATEPALDD